MCGPYTGHLLADNHLNCHTVVSQVAVWIYVQITALLPHCWLAIQRMGLFIARQPLYVHTALSLFSLWVICVLSQFSAWVYWQTTCVVATPLSASSTYRSYMGYILPDNHLNCHSVVGQLSVWAKWAENATLQCMDHIMSSSHLNCHTISSQLILWAICCRTTIGIASD